MAKSLEVESLEAELALTNDAARRLELFEQLSILDPENPVYGAMADLLRKKPPQEASVVEVSMRESAIAYEDFRDEQVFRQEEGQQWRKERGEMRYGKHK